MLWFEPPVLTLKPPGSVPCLDCHLCSRPVPVLWLLGLFARLLESTNDVVTTQLQGNRPKPRAAPDSWAGRLTVCRHITTQHMSSLV